MKSLKLKRKVRTLSLASGLLGLVVLTVTGIPAVVSPTVDAAINNALTVQEDDSSLGTFTTIDVPGATATLAADINAEGYLVGRYAIAGVTHGFLRTPAGEFLTIDFPGASLTVAAGINDVGDIVGQYALPSAPTQRHGFLLKDGVFSSFDPPGSTFTNALGINESGDIVGRYCTLSTCRPPGNGDFRAFLLRDGEYTSLEAPGSIETNAFKINGSGKIAGGLVTPGGAEEVALWRKNTLMTMALPNDKPVSMDNGGVNERGDIVGLYCDTPAPCLIVPTGTHGFVISGDEFQTIDVPTAVATAALGINARGDIVGSYFDSARRIHGFLLTRSPN
jgi:uncharacterized membrane protein